jgi:hypothetical protein
VHSFLTKQQKRRGFFFALIKCRNEGLEEGPRLESSSNDLRWRDFVGNVHACRSVDLKEAFLLILTYCDRFVPPNARYASPADGAVTCLECESKSHAAGLGHLANS